MFAGEHPNRVFSALPVELHPFKAGMVGFEPTTARLKAEGTLFFHYRQNKMTKKRPFKKRWTTHVHSDISTAAIMPILHKDANNHNQLSFKVNYF